MRGHWRGSFSGAGLGLGLLVALSGSSVEAAGLAVFEQGAKAVGLAGAFTARADDPSANFHNPAGLAFLGRRAFQAGATIISVTGADFVGADPFPGIGTTDSSESILKTPPHFYWAEPMGDKWVFGLGLNSPFGLSSEWTSRDFPGRYISSKGALVSYDLNPNLAWRAADSLAIAVGAIVRFSEFELERHLPLIDPFQGGLVDVATIGVETELETGFGFQVGLLGRPTQAVSWGLSYKSAIETDYGGSGRLSQRLTGFGPIDNVVSTLFPLARDLPLSTTLEFPAMASVGLAAVPAPRWLAEFDVNWTGWSSFDRIDIGFGGALPSSRIEQFWRDVYSYRVGFSRSTPNDREWRFGFYLDETPQPLETLGPLVHDGDRLALSVGYGLEMDSVALDLALVYVPIDNRQTQVNSDGFFGSYESTATVFAATVGW